MTRQSSSETETEQTDRTTDSGQDRCEDRDRDSRVRNNKNNERLGKKEIEVVSVTESVYQSQQQR